MSYQPNNQSSLDKLMQMATLEQLNNMMQQLNKNTNTNSISNAKETTDILSLPLVQKVVMAYEDELKTKKNTVGCQLSVNDFVPLFDTVLSKMDEQTREYNSNLLRIENKVDQLFALLEKQEREKQERERQEREKQQQSVDVDKSQLKLTSFPCFFRKYDMFDLTVNEEIISEKHIEEETVKEEIICEKYIEEETVKSEEYKENITLKIEEKDILESDEDSDDVIEDPPVTRLTIEEDEVVDDELNDDEASDEEAAEDKVAIEDEAVEDKVVDDDLNNHEEAAEDKAVDDDLNNDEAVSVEEEEDEVVSVEESEEEVRTEDGSEEIDTVVEVKENEASDEEEEEEEVFEIEIDDVTYFATDEENGILYEVDNGDVGRKVGIIKDGEPIFS